MFILTLKQSNNPSFFRNESESKVTSPFQCEVKKDIEDLPPPIFPLCLFSLPINWSRRSYISWTFFLRTVLTLQMSFRLSTFLAIEAHKFNGVGLPKIGVRKTDETFPFTCFLILPSYLLNSPMRLFNGLFSLKGVFKRWET